MVGKKRGVSHGRRNRKKEEGCKESYAKPPHGPRIRRASWISRVMSVTRLAWIAHRLLWEGVSQELEPSRGHWTLTHPRTNGRGTPQLLLEVP